MKAAERRRLTAIYALYCAEHLKSEIGFYGPKPEIASKQAGLRLSATRSACELIAGGIACALAWPGSDPKDGLVIQKMRNHQKHYSPSVRAWLDYVILDVIKLLATPYDSLRSHRIPSGHAEDLFGAASADPTGPDALDPDEHTAILAWIETHGRTWKDALRMAWETGDYDGSEHDGALQRIRNKRGPSWLSRFKLPASPPTELADERARPTVAP